MTINAMTIKNKYLLSLISKLILQLQNIKYFISNFLNNKLRISWRFEVLALLSNFSDTFLSKSLFLVKCNYKIYTKKILAVFKK